MVAPGVSYLLKTGGQDLPPPRISLGFDFVFQFVSSPAVGSWWLPEIGKRISWDLVQAKLTPLISCSGLSGLVWPGSFAPGAYKQT